MKLTTGILAVVMMTGAAWGQNPGAIDNTRSDAKSLPHQTKTTTCNPCWWRKRPSQHRALRRRR